MSVRFGSETEAEKLAQLITEIRFLLEHSVEARKTSIKEYFSLLLKFNQQAAAKHLKDYYHGQNQKFPIDSEMNESLMEFSLQIFIEYESIYLDLGEEILWKIIDHLLSKINLYDICSECYSWQIINLPILKKERLNRLSHHYYCSVCKKPVNIYQQFELFPEFLEYFIRLGEDNHYYKKIKKKLFKKFGRGLHADSKRHQNLIIFLYQFLEDLYQYAVRKLNIKGIYAIWAIAKKLGFKDLCTHPTAHEIISTYLMEKMEKSDFSDYSFCLDALQKISPPGSYNFKDYYLKGGIEKNILRALSTANVESFNHSYTFAVDKKLINSLDFIALPHFEAACVRGFYYALETDHLQIFEELYHLIHRLGLNFHPKEIPNRYQLLSNLILKSIKLRRLDHLFPILRFGLKYSLFEFPLMKYQKDLIKRYRRKRNLRECLNVIFNFRSEKENKYLIYFLYRYLPSKILDFFMESLKIFASFDEIINFLNEFLNSYSLYGLSLKKIGTTANFFKKISPLLKSQVNFPDEVNFEYNNRIILLSLANIRKIRDIIRTPHRKFQFLLAGMVIKGGLGPEGYGFAYFTPRGELVEICSDIRQNRAYVVKFKQFLKIDFIRELESRIHGLGLSENQRSRLYDIIDGHTEDSKKIGMKTQTKIFSQIRDFLEDEFDFNRITSHEKESLFITIRDKIKAILMPITLVDQYRCRLDLLFQNKLKPEEIAKLTSLEEVSHFDILCERYFYQSILYAMKQVVTNEEYSDNNNEDLI